jgi:hypothetical protein
MSRRTLAAVGIIVVGICQVAANHLLWGRPVLRGDVKIMGYVVMAGLIIWAMRRENASN